MIYNSHPYGVSRPRVPKPVATSPYTTYGGLSPYQAQPLPKLPTLNKPGTITQPGQPQFDTADTAPVTALSTPAIDPNNGKYPALPPTPSHQYDINTDPALQAITALTGRSDADAQAAALQQEQGQLLGYGDPALALATLNDPTIAQAAAANPTSTVAQLGTSRDRNVHDLTENLNKQNLFYGGYRVTQEQQAAQDYQNALANAAAAVQGNLSTIQGNLAQALSANQAQRIAAMQAAYIANATNGSSTGPVPTDYVSSSQPGTIYQAADGSLVSQQPYATAPAYTGPSGQIVSPTTYAGAGATPGPITSDMVAAPVYQPGGAPNPYSSTNAIADPNLGKLAAALYTTTPSPTRRLA